MAREFHADSLNELRLIDNITEHPTSEGRLRLCAAKNTRSNRTLGYSLDTRMISSERGTPQRRSRIALAADPLRS